MSSPVAARAADFHLHCDESNTFSSGPDNPQLTAAYEKYKRSISHSGVVNGNEVLVFHGCSESTITLGAPDNMLEHGFLKKYWKTSAGAWQRFGPGFYFGQQASKSP